MSTAAFDAFTRRAAAGVSRRAAAGVSRRAAAGVSRRASLLTLGGAALAVAAANPTIAAAKKNKNKKAKKKAKKKAQQKCQQQVQECETALAQVGSEEFAFCCQFLSNCDATAFIQCIAN